MRRILTLSFSVFLFMLNAQTFTELPQSPPIIGLSSPAIALADIDGDNDKDLVITGRDAGNPSATHFSKLYTNDGAGNFSEVADAPFPASYFGSILAMFLL